jgi:hypothetical protein
MLLEDLSLCVIFVFELINQLQQGRKILLRINKAYWKACVPITAANGIFYDVII